jgi:hypothetical protein
MYIIYQQIWEAEMSQDWNKKNMLPDENDGVLCP